MSDHTACILRIPPLYTSLRINLFTISQQDAAEQTRNFIFNSEPSGSAVVEQHDTLRDVLLVKGEGPNCVSLCDLEIYVDRLCGRSVMRGAPLYRCGIVGSNRDFSRSELASVFMFFDRDVLKGRRSPFVGPKVPLGNGRVQFSRTELFKTSKNVHLQSEIGVEFTERIWRIANLAPLELSSSWCFLQNLPSVVCVHVLDPQPHELILDMCAAPGGKSTHIAALMRNTGVVCSLDLNPNRLKQLETVVKRQRLTNVRAWPFNGCRAVDDNERTPVPTLASGGGADEMGGPPWPSSSFDRILVDAPCSALGQRPLTVVEHGAQLSSYAPVQKSLLTAASALLKPGGVLVYSTCTLRQAENEAQVRWFLDKFPQMSLAPQTPRVAQTVCAASDHLSPQEAGLLQKFDPMTLCQRHCSAETNSCLDAQSNDATLFYSMHCNQTAQAETLGCNEDTLGFFIAKFVKDKNCS